MTTYESYGYLTPGADYRAFDLSPEFGRVPPYIDASTNEERDHADRLLTESVVISLHDHPVRFPANMNQTPEYNRTGRQHTAFAGLKGSGLTVVFDNMMDGTACVTGNAPWRWTDIITDLGMRQADIEHQNEVVVVRRLSDIDGSELFSDLKRPLRLRTRLIDLMFSMDWVFDRSVSPTQMPIRLAAGLVKASTVD
jgi:membrane dipeptidase